MRYRKEFHEWEGIAAWCWPRIARELPPPKKLPFLRSRRKGGRPHGDDRRALSAIFWRLRCGGTWERLPERFGPAVTARRRQDLWLRGGFLEKAWRAYLEQQSMSELERWREGLEAADVRKKSFWRFGLDYIWKWEFEPLLSKKL